MCDEVNLRITHLRITHYVSYPEVAVIRIADLDGDVFGKGQQRRQERFWLERQSNVSATFAMLLHRLHGEVAELKGLGCL